MKIRHLVFLSGFTGCDKNSCFRGWRKKTAWKIWLAFPEVALTFKEFCSKRFTPVTATSKLFSKIQRFRCLYAAQRFLSLLLMKTEWIFPATTSRTWSASYPLKIFFSVTLMALCLDLASGWRRTVPTQTFIPSTESFGLKWLHSQPVWLTLLEASETCRISFIRCSCKGDC